MLLIGQAGNPISRVEIEEPGLHQDFAELEQRAARTNPYPGRWAGIDFAVDFGEEFDTTFTVCATLAHPPSTSERERIREELFAWAPGLINGAYGVAPVPPDSCIGLPDSDVLFAGCDVEWIIRNFLAHSSAIEGLVNVFARISHEIVPVTEFRIE
jgi:hypothetical protein